MPTEIGPNKSILYGAIAVQALCIIAISYFSFDLIKHWSAPYGNRKFSDVIVIVLTIVGSARYVRMFYSMPYWVTVDDQLKTLDIKYFLQKPVIVSRESMLSYNDTTIKVSTRSGTYNYSGFYLHLGDCRKVLFSERNFAIEDCVYIESMLAYWGVTKGEDE